MGRRILNRKELRADFDAAAKKSEVEDEDEVEDDDDEADAEKEVKPKRKRKAAGTTTKRKPRARTAKVVRMRVVWGVYDNSNKCVAKYDYNKKTDAEEHAAKLTASKTNNVHFVNPIKEAMEEKVE